MFLYYFNYELWTTIRNVFRIFWPNYMYIKLNVRGKGNHVESALFG